MKTKLSAEQLIKITDLFNEDYGSRKIAKIIGVNRSTIIRAYKQLNLDSASKKPTRTAYKAIEKCCKICNEIKSVDFFRKRIRNDRISYETYCVVCEKKYNNKRSAQRYKNNKLWYQQYRSNNLNKIIKYDNNYRAINKDILREKSRVRNFNKRKINPTFKLRIQISNSINIALKKYNSSKNGKSCLKHLNYSIKELKEHLENQFEPWMTWANHGKYNAKSWNDNDFSTWTWQIDHIIPHSTFIYKSMEDENFQKCWDLCNLRPLSAKQNLLDGTRKTRH